jgi:hypothetical protein
MSSAHRTTEACSEGAGAADPSTDKDSFGGEWTYKRLAVF